MSVKTSLSMRKANTSQNFEFISGIEDLGLPGIEGRFEDILEMGGDGRVDWEPTGVTEVTTFDVKLYWNVEWHSSRINEQQRALLEAASSQEMQELRIRYKSGWLWTLKAYVKSFKPSVPKGKKERATVTIRPKKIIAY